MYSNELTSKAMPNGTLLQGGNRDIIIIIIITLLYSHIKVVHNGVPVR